MITQTFESASSSAIYTAQLDPATGEASCTCPAWRFVRPGKPRGCKHTTALRSQQGATMPAPAAPRATTTRPTPAAPSPLPAQAAAPTGQPKPMLASAMTETTLDDYTTGGWLLEEKFDGHRVIVEKAGAVLTAWSRPRAGKTALPRELPAQILTALRHLPDGVYDGELCSPGGKSWDVARLDTKAGQILMLFDVLAVYGQSTVAKPYIERRQMLDLCIRHLPLLHDAPLSTPTAVPVTIEAVHAIWARGGEGAILKREASTYQPGRRSDDWIKVKREGAVVGIITGFQPGKSGPYSTVALRLDSGIETTVKTKDNATLRAIATDPSAYIGKRLVIAYCELTPDGKPRHGVWDHLAGAGE